ncbi:Uncharacterised protein [Serratia ficaria]|nr:Uncharacterised protein [Serratia ficaria]
MLHLVSCGLVYLLVGFGSLSVLRARPQAARRVSRISGAAMLIIAIGLLLEQALK